MERNERMPKWQYVIVVDGVLGDRWKELFTGMEVVRHGGTTTIRGTPKDPSALHGILKGIMDFNLDPISVRRFQSEVKNGYSC